MVLDAIQRLSGPRRNGVRNPSSLLRSLIQDISEIRRGNGVRIGDGRPAVDKALERLYQSGRIPDTEMITSRGLEVLRKTDEAIVLKVINMFMTPGVRPIDASNPFMPQLLSRIRNEIATGGQPFNYQQQPAAGGGAAVAAAAMGGNPAAVAPAPVAAAGGGGQGDEAAGGGDDAAI